MKKRSVVCLSILSMLVVAGFVGCGNPFSDGSGGGGRLSVNAGGAYVPPSLTGGVGYSNGVSGGAIWGQQLSPPTAAQPEYVDITRAVIDQWVLQYGNQIWWMVASTSTEVNNEIIRMRRSIGDLSSDEVRSISQPPFTLQATISENDVVRFDGEGRNWEIFRNFDGEHYTVYSRFEESEGVRRQLRVMNVESGDNRLIEEIYETGDFTYFKSLLWNNTVSGEAPPQLSHLIAVVDNRTPEMRTTARRMGENRMDNNTDIHVMTHDRGSRAGWDYGLVVMPNMQPVGFPNEITGVDLMNVFSFFTREDFNVLLPDDYDPEKVEGVHKWPFITAAEDFTESTLNTLKPEYEEFIHPDDIGLLFEQGFTEADWPTLLEAIKDGAEGIEFKDWDLSGATWLN